MAIGSTLNQIDTLRDQSQTNAQLIRTAREDIRSAETQIRQLTNDQLVQDIRDINTNGLSAGNVDIQPGFLDAVPDGEQQVFEWSNSNRTLEFVYIKDRDLIRINRYLKNSAPKVKEEI